MSDYSDDIDAAVNAVERGWQRERDRLERDLDAANRRLAEARAALEQVRVKLRTHDCRGANAIRAIVDTALAASPGTPVLDPVAEILAVECPKCLRPAGRPCFEFERFIGGVPAFHAPRVHRALLSPTPTAPHPEFAHCVHGKQAWMACTECPTGRVTQCRCHDEPTPTAKPVCETCGGAGRVVFRDGAWTDSKPCPACQPKPDPGGSRDAD